MKKCMTFILTALLLLSCTVPVFAADISDENPSTGDTVSITPKPDTGKVVDKITVTDKDGNKIEVKDNGDGSYSYEQPDGDVTVEVTFKDKEYRYGR